MPVFLLVLIGGIAVGGITLGLCYYFTLSDRAFRRSNRRFEAYDANGNRMVDRPPEGMEWISLDEARERLREQN
jgi:hypothetical protein